MHNGGRCFARITLHGKTLCKFAVPQVHGKDWIRDCVSTIVAQEAQPPFRARAISCLGNASILQGPPSKADAEADWKGSKIIVLVGFGMQGWSYACLWCAS